MSDADIDEAEGTTISAASEGSGKGNGAAVEGDRRGPSRYRKPGLAVARALVVLVVAGVGYQVWVPVHHKTVTKVVRSRLADLVIKQSGVAGFKAKPTSAGAQATANLGLAALTTAAKQSPNQTGLYSIDWESSPKGSHDGIGVVAFLLPTPAQAQTVLAEVSKMELSATAQKANSLTRTGTYTIPGLPGSAGSIFEPTKKTNTSQELVVALSRQGKVVAFVQEAKTSNTAAGAAVARNETEAVMKSESKHLATVEPGFSLVQVVRPAWITYPLVASIVWILGSVIVAALAAAGPLAFGWARRRRRERIQAELDRLIVVRGQTITKRRR